MTSTSNPSLVTVLVDTYNHEQFIDQAIRSVLDQEFEMSRVEIIVVDDGSTDRTPEKLATYGDRIRVISKKNGGQASAFNVGVAEARGSIIAMLDGDDWWHPQKLASVINCLENNPKVGMIGHGIVFTDGAGTEEKLVPSAQVSFSLDSADGATRLGSHRCFMGTSRLTGRAEVFRRLLPVPEDLIVEADEDFFTLGPAISTAVILPDALCYYRLHGGNLYQYSSGYDPRRLRLKSRVHTCLAKTIPAKLDEFKVPPSAQAVILDYLHMDARRLHLAAFGGFPGAALPVEWHLLRTNALPVNLSSWLVKCLMLLLAAVLPAGWFYRLRTHWSTVRTPAGSWP